MTSDREIQDGAPSTLGPLLRQARDQAGLKQADIARQLHLDVKIIAALEADDDGALPAPMYVRGYLRHYAGLLGMPPEDLLHKYNARAAPLPPIKSGMSGANQTSGADAPVRAVTWFVSLALVLLVVAWGLSGNIQTPETAGVPTAGVRAPVEAPAQVQGVAAQDEVPAITEQPPQAGDAPGILPTTETTAGQAADDRVQAQEQAPAAPATGEPEAGTVETSGPDAAPPLGDSLRLKIHKDSWIDVKDATGTSLYTALARAGQEIDLAGQAPISVLLGNAAGVGIEYNGEPVDFGRYTAGNVARFKLGETAAGE